MVDFRGSDFDNQNEKTQHPVEDAGFLFCYLVAGARNQLNLLLVARRERG